MGSSFSSLNNGTNGSATGPSLGDIPESCVACVILHLTPPEICNLARLNRAFRGAASSDSVWEKKLPRNYQDLLDLLPPERYRSLSKKDIFALLSRPLPFDDGNKVCWNWELGISPLLRWIGNWESLLCLLLMIFVAASVDRQNDRTGLYGDFCKRNGYNWNRRSQILELDCYRGIKVHRFSFNFTRFGK